MKNIKNPYSKPKTASDADTNGEKGKNHVADLLANAGKNAAKLAGNAKNAVVKAMDYNSDGKLDFGDFSAIAKDAEEKRERDRLAKEYNILKPIFAETILSPEFTLPKLIRIADIDKKHAEGQSCLNSIGYISEYEGLQIITIYPTCTNMFGLRFYPDINSEIYYVDPWDRDYYISLEEYFKYLRLKRVNELQEVAQALGAKHFKVSYVEQEKNDTANKIKLGVGAKNKGSAEGSHETEAKELNKVEFGGEMKFVGHEPVEPTLHYLKGDPNIEALIKMRMSKNAPIHQKVSISLISSLGIKVKDAAKIDGALRGLHFNADGSFQKGAMSEARTVLEYEIDY